ncbi:MAG TPA: DUF58 domain-containing protein [Polyangiales bacterium]|nr:DUF58 domain-containing protein [Polyangiales bacterium]
MLPLPTTNAFITFIAACCMVGLGIVTNSALAIMLGSTALLGLASVFALTLPVGARLRRDRLELAWWHTHGEPVTARGSVVAGARFEVQASLRHFGARTLVLSQLAPAHGPALRCVRGAQGAVVLPGQSRSEFELGFIALAPGRLVLHGLSVMVHGPLDLFRAPLYFPIPLVIRALPRSAVQMNLALRQSSGVVAERAGQVLRHTPGGGTELRELRELVPGDAFKTIAWKASARAGKLMVRDVESEVQESLYLVLDISGTMRGGALGDRKLDYAIELAASLARDSLARGDRAGVLTVDGRVVGHAPARDGLSHMARLHEVLLGATEIIDPDLTEADDDEVIALVARYVRHQDGLDVRTPTGHDVDALVRQAQGALTGEHEPRAASKPAIPSDPRVQVLRRFCRARGIDLRYRAETRGHAKGQGLAQALRTAAGDSRVPRSIVVITDFDGITDTSVLEATVRMLRARQHALSFIVPQAQSLLPAPASRLVRDLHLVYGLGEARRARQMQALLYKLGVPLVVSARRPGPRAVLGKVAT